MLRTPARKLVGPLVLTLGLALAGSARADTRSVGPGKTYAAPCAAFAAASDGDTIEIAAAGTYVGDVCAIAKNNLTIRGVGGRAAISAGGQNAQGKAIWVIQGHDTVVEDIELSGCSVPDMNGAGIRQEGPNLTVRRSYFHDNQDGILTDADATSVIVIEDSEFANNGAGDGQSHNMYIGEVKSFTLQGSYSHSAKVGHLVKSRALTNHIRYNRLTDEGTASYEIDLPQGGPSFLIGNLFGKSQQASNSAFVSYARESKRNANSGLWVVGNTFANTRASGTFVAVASDVTSVTLRDNIFSGPGTICDLPAAVSEANFVGDPLFADPTRYDFHLQMESPAINEGIAPGMANGESLTPFCQYVHPAQAVVRNPIGALDQGALELGGESSTPCPENPGDTTTPVVMLDAGVMDDMDAGSPLTSSSGAVGGDTGTRPGNFGGPIDESDGGSPPLSTNTHSSGGGCRTAPGGSGTTLSALLSLLLVLAMMRRRRGG